jgi:gliding motility-associated-like protein
MKKKWDICLPRILAIPLFFLVLVLGIIKSSAQECPQLISPINGANQVTVNSSISWVPVTGVPGYLISLGTFPGGTDIINEQNVGSSSTFEPTVGLPENTEIFVTITLFFFNQDNIVCDSQSFTTLPLSEAPECTTLNTPTNNAININAATNISWNIAPSATGYFLTIGTTMTGGEFFNNDVGNTLSYTPVIDLPAEAEIYVTIIPYNRIGMSTGCTPSVFTTAPVATLPSCTSLISPFDGETNVPLSPILEWNVVPNAIGYRVSIGTSPFETNILDDALFYSNATMVIDFEPNRTFFILIVPFNEAGEAIGCMQETFSTLLGCGPYFDPGTGELRVFNPDLSFPDVIGICLDRQTNTMSATDTADGYRWYKVDASGRATKISNSFEVEIDEAGEYIYEAYAIIEDSGSTIECPSSKTFQVEASEAPVITDVRITQQSNGITLETQVDGIGSYEYALDDETGPYQDSNRFTNVAPGNHIIFVRDQNGCGIAQQTIEQDLTVDGFPKFFTPNGDGVNDFWQFMPPIKTRENTILSIWIYDRFGAFLAQIEPVSQGWNGMLNGRALPESNYWFKALSAENKEIKGYFSLKR